MSYISLSFKVTNLVYFLKISITCIKKIIPLLNLLINCIWARSATQTFSIKDKRTFRFLKFLIIGLCNTSANTLFEIFSFLIPLPPNLFSVARVAKVSNRKVSHRAQEAEAFYQKVSKLLKQEPFDIHHIWDF